MEGKKSKSFNKSKDYTVDERDSKVFLLEQQKPVPSWPYFLHLHSFVWQLQFTVYVLQSIAITSQWAIMCTKNSPTGGGGGGE